MVAQSMQWGRAVDGQHEAKTGMELGAARLRREYSTEGKFRLFPSSTSFWPTECAASIPANLPKTAGSDHFCLNILPPLNIPVAGLRFVPWGGPKNDLARISLKYIQVQ